MQTVPKPMEPINPLSADLKIASYLAGAAMLGLLSALASVLGNESKALTVRVICAYLLAGALVSAGITFLLVQHYGFSYFLLGVAIFAGYKAFDTLALIGIAISNLVKRFLAKK
jgi:hypothetical protein